MWYYYATKYTNSNLISDGGSDGDTAVISKGNSGMYHVYINHTDNETLYFNDKIYGKIIELYLMILIF